MGRQRDKLVTNSVSGKIQSLTWPAIYFASASYFILQLPAALRSGLYDCYTMTINMYAFILLVHGTNVTTALSIEAI